MVVTMDGPRGTICSAVDGPAGPVVARTIYGVTAPINSRKQTFLHVHCRK